MRDICERTFRFALRIMKLCQQLEERRGVARTLGWQLLRSGTSIGANVEEAQAGQSKLDFISKNAIALKEARETLLVETAYRVGTDSSETNIRTAMRSGGVGKNYRRNNCLGQAKRKVRVKRKKARVAGRAPFSFFLLPFAFLGLPLYF